MDYKWIGAVLIMTGCGGYGFALCVRDREEIRALKNLIRVLEFMAWELQFQMTPLPEICQKAGNAVNGIVGKVFSLLADALQSRMQPDVSVCMDLTLSQLPHMPETARAMLMLLGNTLGRYDLEGQLEGLETVRTGCIQALSEMEKDKHQRMRTYQTLGLCTGAALAILLV